MGLQKDQKTIKEYCEMVVPMVDEYMEDENSPRFRTILNKVGYVLTGINSFYKAKELLDKALQIDSVDTVAVEAHNNRAILASAQRKYEEADEHYQKAREVQEKINGKSHPDLAIILSNIAENEIQLKQYDLAMENAKKSAGINRSVFGERHISLATDYNTIGVALLNKQQFDEAKQYIEQAIDIHSKNQGNNTTLLRYKGNLAQVLHGLGQMDQAKSIFEKVTEKGTHNPYMAHDLVAFGRLLRDLQQTKQAKECFERAIGIEEKKDNGNCETLAVYLNDYGSVLRVLGRENGAEAKECFEKAIKLIDGGDQQTLAECHYNLGLVLQGLGQNKPAKKSIKDAIDIYKKVENREPRTLAIYYKQLGIVLHDLKKYVRAKEYFEKAIATDEQMDEEDRQSLAIWLHTLGLSLQYLRKYEKAKECIEKANNIYKQVDDGDTQTLRIHLNTLGLLLQDRGQHPLAKGYFERAITVKEQVDNEDPQKLGKYFKELGLKFLEEFKNYEQAKDCLERAIAIEEEMNGGHTQDLLSLLIYLARV